MIWYQDGDPPPVWDRPHEAARLGALATGNWPTCQELREATAHELADTVVQILCGDGITYGLGALCAPRIRRRYDFYWTTPK